MDPLDHLCPTCGALIGARCRVPRGRFAKEPHLARRQIAGCDVPQTGRPPTLLRVPCPVCSASIGERCVTETGKVHCSGHDARRLDAGMMARRVRSKP